MSQIKIGYLPLYIKLYDDSEPDARIPMVAYMHECVRQLKNAGLEVVCANVCRLKEEFDDAIATFKAAHVDAVVTQHLAYSPSLESIGALLSLNEIPIVILDTTPDYDISGQMYIHDAIMSNHGIHGVQDMCCMLRKNGRSYTLCVGHLSDSGVISQVAAACRAAKAARQFREARIGSVGGSFKGMGDFYLTPDSLKKQIGADIFYLDPASSERYLSEVTDDELRQEIDWENEHFQSEIKNHENHALAVKSGLALRHWMKAQALTAITVNFLSLQESGLPKMPFTECCKALMRGQGYAGEGDVLTAGLVGALRTVYPDTTFSEMFCPDWKNDMILLSHMGEMNLNLSQWKPVLADAPFSYNSTGDTAAAYGCLRAGDAVLVNLAPMQEGFSMIVTPVSMQDVGRDDNVYRHENQGWMKPLLPVRDFLKAYSELGGTHHCALVYHSTAEELKTFGRMMGFNCHIIG